MRVRRSQLPGWLLCVLLVLGYAPTIQSQYLPLDSDAYTYIRYRMDSGSYRPDYHLRQPYRLDAELRQLLESSKYYFDGILPAEHMAFTFEGRLGGHFGASTQRDLGAQGTVQYRNQQVTFVNRTGFDSRYLVDPYYPGELSEADTWIYGRVQDAYVNLELDNFTLFGGRMQRNWGPPGLSSLILSNNPYSYDHLSIDYTDEFMKIGVFAARLEDMDAQSYQKKDSTITSTSGARRFLTGHRLDVDLSENIQVALTEMAIFGGKDRDFDASFLIPTAFYYDLQRNTDRTISGLWALDFSYRLLGGSRLTAQFLIDDVIVNNEPGIDDRRRYPDRLGLSMTCSRADIGITGLYASMSYVRIWNHTYQSRNTWENYHTHGLGLAYPFAGSEEVLMELSYWGFRKTWVKMLLVGGRYGAVELTDLFRLTKDEFPLGPAIQAWNYDLTIQRALGRTWSGRIHFSGTSDPLNPRWERKGESSGFLIQLGLRARLDMLSRPDIG